MNETIEVDGLATQAITAAYEDARSSGLSLENYKPQGHRGALAGLPEPSLLIEKRAGRVLQKHLSR
jgi:hypothetical protein